MHGVGAFCWDLPELVLALLEKPQRPRILGSGFKVGSSLGSTTVRCSIMVCRHLFSPAGHWNHFLVAQMAGAWPAPWGVSEMSLGCLF